MDYKKIYDNLMIKCSNEHEKRLKEKNDGCYFEKHHKIPKCLNGNNDKNNLVLLTAKEHYLSHHLLIKIYPNNNKLVYSFWMMCNGTLKNRPKPNQRLYQESRLLFSLMKLGSKHSEKTKLLISNTQKERFKGQSGTFLGKKHSEESLKKMSNSLKNRVVDVEVEKKRRERISITSQKPKSNEHCENIRLAKLNDKNPMYGKTGKEHHNSKPIQQYTKDGILVKNWENGLIASNELGLSYKGINRCLNSKSKSSGNFIWKFI